MSIVKYKLEKGNDGEGRIPAVVEDGGYYYSNIDQTMLGWMGETSTGFFLPSFAGNIVHQTKTDVVNRALAMHAVEPWVVRQFPPSEEPAVTLTEAQVTEQMEQWYDDMYVAKTGSVYVPTNEEVNVERERRISLGCTISIDTVGSIFVTGDAEDIRNMAGLGQGALARIVLGDTTTLVPYRDGNNDVFDLTPPQMLELWQKSAGYVSAVYQASWVLKANTIPVDFKTNDSYWPVPSL